MISELRQEVCRGCKKISFETRLICEEGFVKWKCKCGEINKILYDADYEMQDQADWWNEQAKEQAKQ